MRIILIVFLASVIKAKICHAAPQFAVKTVVIDAGHGGKDPGAIGMLKTREKDVALSVALLLGMKIKEKYPDVKVIYTRSSDVFVPLIERANIANRNKADLFISIHCNASTNRAATGSSTYVLGLHKTEENLEVAKRENAVIELEEDVEKNYEFNPNTPEGHIIMSMKQNAFLEQSIDIAARIENELSGNKESKSRGVKQAGFFVLYKTSMPSLLAEIGFISNSTEEMYLASKEGQEEIAEGIFRAFAAYKGNIEKTAKIPSLSASATAAKEKEEEGSFVVAQSNLPPLKTSPDNAPKENKNLPTTSEKKAAETTFPPNNPSSSDQKNKTIAPATVSKESPAFESIDSKNGSPPFRQGEVTNSVPNQQSSRALIKESPAPSPSDQYIFYLQLFASSKPLSAYPKLKDNFANIEVETLPNGIHRFMAGGFSSYEEAEKLIPKAAAMGFADAFVIAYKNGVRLDRSFTLTLKRKY